MIIRDLEYRNNFRKLCFDYLGTDEVWALHPDLEWYLISSYGRIKSLKQNRLMKLQVNGDGYLGVNVHFCSKGRRFVLIHRLVAETFFGYLGLGNYFYEVNHIDGNKTNNNISNLEWLTRKENLDHARQFKWKYTKSGPDNANAKLTRQDINDVIELYELGFKQTEIAKAFNVSRSCINKTYNRREK